MTGVVTSSGMLRLSPSYVSDEDALREARSDLAGFDAPVRIRALGDLQVETADGLVDRVWLGQRPGRLLRYLVAQAGRLVPADQIAEALWPSAPSGAEDNVRYLVHLARKRLEPHRQPRARSLSIDCVGGAYAIGGCVWIDAGAFEKAVEEPLVRFAHGDDVGSLGPLRAALELYRGDFLADEPYEDWAIEERERIRALAEDAIAATSDIYARRRQFESALHYGRWLAELERYDSSSQLRVIKLCLRCGRRGEAARRYAAFRARLLKDFGQEPEFTLAGAGASIGSGAARY